MPDYAVVGSPSCADEPTCTVLPHAIPTAFSYILTSLVAYQHAYTKNPMAGGRP